MAPGESSSGPEPAVATDEGLPTLSAGEPSIDTPSVKTDENSMVLSRGGDRHKDQQQHQEEPLKSLENHYPVKKRLLIDFPCEILVETLIHLCPSDVFALARTSRHLHDTIMAHRVQKALVRGIMETRYPTLAKCFALPVLLSDVDETVRAYFQSEEGRAATEDIALKKPDTPTPDRDLICSCSACQLRWIELYQSADFSYGVKWSRRLGDGQTRVDTGTAVVRKALYHPLWFASIIEQFLAAIIPAAQQDTAPVRAMLRCALTGLAFGRLETDWFMREIDRIRLNEPYASRLAITWDLCSEVPGRYWDFEREEWVYRRTDQHDQDIAEIKNILEMASVMDEEDDPEAEDAEEGEVEEEDEEDEEDEDDEDEEDED